VKQLYTVIKFMIQSYNYRNKLNMKESEYARYVIWRLRSRNEF